MEIFDKRYVTFVFVRTEKISYRCAKKTTSPFFSLIFLRLICRDACLEERLLLKMCVLKKNRNVVITKAFSNTFVC